jgi:alpha-glucosidase
MAKATFDGLKKFSPNKRHFVLTRAGFSGTQRYSAVWTGDNYANEEHLMMACVMPQGMGLSGLAFVGSDVGGFMGTPSARLYTRWMQLGAFTPFFRGHSAVNEKAKEPWAFGIDHESYVRDIISLRYKLLPYLYNEFYNTSVTGLPIFRPMMLNYQDDDECYKWDIQYQFMLGENLLVAPVLSETENFKKLYLPEGKWLDWWDGKVYQGKQWIIVEAPINRIPLFVKEGGIIPTIEKQNYVGEKKISQMEVFIFPSKEASYLLYEDDGITYGYKDSIYSITQVKFSSDSFDNKINIGKIVDKFTADRKNYLLKIYSEKDVVEVKSQNLSGEGLLKEYSSIKDLTESDEGFFYESISKFLYIKIKDKPGIQIAYK